MSKILIVYTTAYRRGSDQFKLAAETLATELKKDHQKEILVIPIHGKKELVDLFKGIKEEGKSIDEYHFIGHSGMYGPMYGTIEYPEQFSPFELKELEIPFSIDAKAFFHCCRSARWFAPFFAEQFQIKTYGYHWYTTFSSSREKFKRVNQNSKKVYAVGCPGKKSHGLVGSIKKYSGLVELEKMKCFEPLKEKVDSTYDKVADLYNAVFQDIKVRKDEWVWLSKHFPKKSDLTVVDIGCGNGALLKELSKKISQGIGLDISPAILENAKKLNSTNSNLQFELINGPTLPIQNKSVDVVISLLSFRYLDWDPLMDELRRILKPGGKIMIIDMVTVPPKWHEYPLLLKSKIGNYVQRYSNKEFQKNLSNLVNHRDWKKMLQYNPIRSEHEMKWYLESRFPGKKVEKINVGWNSSILAFDSGNIENIKEIHLSYP